MSKQSNNIVIENAKIGFRNFSGAAGKFNPAGRRNFCVFLEEDLATVLEEDGWNVRWLQPREEEESPTPYLQAAVNYDNIPPKIVLITSRGKTILDESNVSLLDWAEVENVDLILNPYHWDVGGKSGIKAYVKSMYVTITEDELEHKYLDVPDSASNTLASDDRG